MALFVIAHLLENELLQMLLSERCSSIIRNRGAEIGKIKPVIREINLNADRKRSWLGELRSVEDNICNESMPKSLNYFGN